MELLGAEEERGCFVEPDGYCSTANKSPYNTCLATPLGALSCGTTWGELGEHPGAPPVPVLVELASLVPLGVKLTPTLVPRNRVPYSSTENKENPGYYIYSAKQKRYGQTTVTIKKSQLERKTTQVTINSNPLSYE